MSYGEKRFMSLQHSPRANVLLLGSINARKNTMDTRNWVGLLVLLIIFLITIYNSRSTRTEGTP